MRIVGQTKYVQKCIVRIIVQGVHFTDTMTGRSLPLLPFIISFNEFLAISKVDVFAIMNY